jgi:hypothetical protein
MDEMLADRASRATGPQGLLDTVTANHGSGSRLGPGRGVSSSLQK